MALASVAPHAPPLLVLRRALLWRFGVAIAAVVLGLACLNWRAWREQLGRDLPATAALVSQLLNDDLAQHAPPFSRMVTHASLAPLEDLGQRVAFCAEVQDLVGRRLTEGCLPAAGPAAAWAPRLARDLAQGGGAVLSITLPLMLPAGVKAGVIIVEPHWAVEAHGLGQQALTLLGAALALGVLLALASRLVARALAPANQVLIALRRLAQGDLSVRLPPMALAELHHIGEGFNRLAVSVASLERRQQQLAHHLLQAREAERRRLARELHDEMGQSLSALQAEASAIRLMALEQPQARQSAQAMCDTSARLLDGLQRVLSDLRPLGLDEFGLPVALRALSRPPQRRSDGGELTVSLQLPEHWAALPPDHDIHVYRLVQEALTNARRHSQASRMQVRLTRGADWVELDIADNGCHGAAHPLAPGHGLLGMQERVQALGGQVRWSEVAGGGLCLQARWPLAPADEAPGSAAP